MTELYDPLAHEPLVDGAWDPDRVAAAIREIVADAEAAFDDGWPNHPQDDERERPFSTVYLGGAGVVQALDSLERRGLVELRRDYVPYLERPYEQDFFDWEHERSLWMGETGIRLVLHRLAPSTENADRLAELIAANADDERCEVMWGSPGTMLAAAAMHDLTGEARWLELWHDSAAWLRDRWDPETGLWTQHLYGRVEQFIGPAHGFAGCVLALSRDGDAEFHRRAAEATAPLGDRGGRPRELAADLVRWRASAPTGTGRSASSGATDRPESWRRSPTSRRATTSTSACCSRAASSPGCAGPLAKGANLCHGTAGNGYAFLALLERTGDELWLERARAFAMHAAGQVERGRAELGRGRYTLWTGDPGTALFLADCLAGGGAVPLP